MKYNKTMVINYQGKSYFKLLSGEKLILLNPEDQRSFKNALVVINTTYFPQSQNVEDLKGDEAPFQINHQGEYDVKDIKIDGKFLAKEDGAEKTAYSILFDEIKFGIIPPLKKELDIKDLEILENSDILFLPLHNKKDFLSISKMASIARQIEPHIIIPYFIDMEENPKELLKELGKDAIPEEKITIKKKDIEGAEMAVRWIKSK